LSCVGVEQEEVLGTATYLINVNEFIFFIALCDINAILRGSTTTHERSRKIFAQYVDFS
jgi:hypothetical protein